MKMGSACWGVSVDSTPSESGCGSGLIMGGALFWILRPEDGEEEDGAPTAQLEPAPE